MKHRDLMTEAFVELSKPREKLTERQEMEEKFVLIRNTWSTERLPEIQLAALTDVMKISADPAKLDLLKELDIQELLHKIMTGPMVDPAREADLKKRQAELDELARKRKNRELDYVQKKEMDRKEHLVAKDWVQWKADFGRLALVSLIILQNLSCSPAIRPVLVQKGFGAVLATFIAKLTQAEKHLGFLQMMNSGQMMSLLVTEVAEQQLVALKTAHNLALDVESRETLVESGLCKSVVGCAVEKVTKHTPRELECVKILCLLALTNGKTERRIIVDGGLLPLVDIVRDGFGDGLGYAVSAIGHLAFVKENSKEIIESGVMVPLTNVLKEGDEKMQLRAVDVIRNISAAGADVKLVKAVVDELVMMVKSEDGGERRLRALIALRSISRTYEVQQVLVTAGVVQLAVEICGQEGDKRVRGQALGLLYNVIGFTAAQMLDAQEEEDTTEEEGEEDVMAEGEEEKAEERFGEVGGEGEEGGEGGEGEAGGEGRGAGKAGQVGEGGGGGEDGGKDGMREEEGGEDERGSEAGGEEGGKQGLEGGDASVAISVGEKHAADGRASMLGADRRGSMLRRDSALLKGRLYERVKAGIERPVKRANRLMQERHSPFFRLLSERDLQLIALHSSYKTFESGR